MSQKEQKRVAVVTGGGSGIGRAIALVLAQTGHFVVAADLNPVSAEETAQLISNAGGKGAGAFVDITNRNTVNELLQHILSSFGTPWILVNNAGWGGLNESFMDSDPQTWARIAQLNFLGTLTMSQVFLRAMIDAGAGGRVINIGSDSARCGSPGEAVYSGSKGAIMAFTKSLAFEMIAHGILVNCVSPGPADTPGLRRHSEQAQQQWLSYMPMGRFARPDEVASAVRYFASEDASYVSGQILSVSGGCMAGMAG